MPIKFNKSVMLYGYFILQVFEHSVPLAIETPAQPPQVLPVRQQNGRTCAIVFPAWL